MTLRSDNRSASWSLTARPFPARDAQVRRDAAHPYDAVEILATEIVEADPGHRQWAMDSTQLDSDSMTSRHRHADP